MYRVANSAADERVRTALAASAELAHLRSTQKRLELDLVVATEEVAKRKARMASEREDVERYEGGVWAFLYDVFADREGRLSKERRELAAATASYEETAAEHTRLTEVVQDLQRRLVALAGADDELIAARAAKREEVRAGGGVAADQLTQLEEELEANRARGVVIAEAVTAGEQVRATLARMTAALASASSWGTADLISDSILVSMAKRSRMDDARGLAGVAQAELSTFRAELADVGLALDATVSALPDHGRFLDVWLDNIFTDVGTQSRIADARATTTQVAAAVGGALAELAELRRRLDDRTQAIEASVRGLTDGSP